MVSAAWPVSLYGSEMHRWDHVRMHAHIHTHRHTSATTHPSVNRFPPKEMAHLSWDIPNRLINLLQKLSVQGLAWDLVWSSWRGTLKMSHLPWKRGFAGKRQSEQLFSCVSCWDDCTAPPFITKDNPLLWDSEGGDGTGNKIARSKRKATKEILSTELRFLYNIKFGNKTRNIWSTCSLFPL